MTNNKANDESKDAVVAENATTMSVMPLKDVWLFYLNSAEAYINRAKKMIEEDNLPEARYATLAARSELTDYARSTFGWP